MGLFDSGSPSITVAVDVLFPSNVTSGPGITVNKTNSVWSVNIDIVDLTENTSISTPSGYYVMVWDTALTRLEKVRLDNLNLPTLVDFRSPIGDANYAVSVNDRYVGLTATLSAIRTITLPAASTVPAGRQIVIQDEVGGISPAFYHSIVPTGTDTINGGASWIQKTTRGGVVLRSNGSNAWNVLIPFQRTAVADAAYTATFGDALIAYTSITAPRIVTLPAAAAYQKGQQLVIVDESGSCSATNTIGINRAGADTINGGTNVTLATAYSFIAVESDGVSKWTVVDSGAGVTSAVGNALATAASVPAQRVLLRIDQRTGIGDAAYTILNTDAYVATTATLTAARTWTLPAANTLNPGQEIVIYDEFGGVTSTNTLTIARAGADTLNGGTSFVLDRAYQGISLRSNGVNGWAFEDPAGPIDGTPIGQTTPAAGAFTSLSATASASLSPSGAVTVNPTTAGTIDNMVIGGTTPKAATVTSMNGGPLAGFRNRIINGGFSVDQRNAGAAQMITAGAALAYTVDRFYAYCNGANVTGQRIASSGASGSPSQYVYQFTGAASVSAIGFGQRIEASNSFDLAGANANLSVSLGNSVLTTVTWTAYYANSADSFGTLASPSHTQFATGTFTVNSTLTKYSALMSIPAAAATGVEIVFTVGAQTSGTWQIGNVQLEGGSVATPFERRGSAAEVMQCQRYYERTTISLLQSPTSGPITVPLPFSVQKRAAPTATTITAPTYASASGASFSTTTVDAWYVQITSSGTGGNATGWVIDASAEL